MNRARPRPRPGTPPRDCLTTAQAAARLQVSVQTITRWLHKGRLPYWQHGRGYPIRIEAAAVEAFALRYVPAPSRAVLTMKEAAAVARVGEERMRAWCRDGWIPSTTSWPGGHLSVRREDLDAFLAHACDGNGPVTAFRDYLVEDRRGGARYVARERSAYLAAQSALGQEAADGWEGGLDDRLVVTALPVIRPGAAAVLAAQEQPPLRRDDPDIAISKGA